MKKIMFDDRFCMTQAVLDKLKDRTRRLVPQKILDAADAYVQRVHGTGNDFLDYLLAHAPYKVGEVVAVAQSYLELGIEFVDHADPTFRRKHVPKWGFTQRMKGWKNKMYVRADVMPHQIRFTDIRVERIQDISDEDCIKEGIEEDAPYYWVPINRALPNWRKLHEAVSDMYPGRDGKVCAHFWDSPKKAFSALFKKLYGKKVWDDNPYVYVYAFELVK